MRRSDPDRHRKPPPRLDELREAGIPISMSCPGCSATWLLDPHQVAGDDLTPVMVLASSQTCSACGRDGGLGAVPLHRPWVLWLRKTGQHRRLPYTAAFVRDEEA